MSKDRSKKNMSALEMIEEKVKGRERLTNEPMPRRKEIRKALGKISNFTEDEMEVLYFSSFYKAYSLIVRYGQKGVEDAFRLEKWFMDALDEKGLSVKSAS